MYQQRLEQNNTANTILVVEDQIEDHVLAKQKILALWPDCEIVPVFSLKDAYIACRKKSFDLIILDLNLPDGFGACSVREMRRFIRHIPIIVVTSVLSDATTYEALKNGANNIVSKNQMHQDDFFEILMQNTEKRILH